MTAAPVDAPSTPGPAVRAPGWDHPVAHLEVGGQRIAYVDVGEGPPVVAVHGNPTWGFAFRTLVAGLIDRHRLVVPDHVGMGRSSRPDRDAYPHVLARRIADLEELVDRVVGDGPVSMVVHDWGGPIGLGWAVRHPERVGRILVLNTAAFPLPHGTPLPRLLRVARSALGAAAIVAANSFVVGTVALGAHRRLPTDVARGYLAPYDSPARRTAIRAFVEDIPLAPGDASWDALCDVSDRLEVLDDGRVAICWGMRDPVFTAAILREWRRRLPSARVVELAHAGHLVLEDAAPEVLDVARRHLLAGAP